jgi:hypothetical protein
MALFFTDGLVLSYPDEFDTNSICFRWGELPPAIVKEMAERLWDEDPKDPRIAELNNLYTLLRGEAALGEPK